MCHSVAASSPGPAVQTCLGRSFGSTRYRLVLIGVMFDSNSPNQGTDCLGHNEGKLSKFAL